MTRIDATKMAIAARMCGLRIWGRLGPMRLVAHRYVPVVSLDAFPVEAKGRIASVMLRERPNQAVVAIVCDMVKKPLDALFVAAHRYVYLQVATSAKALAVWVAVPANNCFLVASRDSAFSAKVQSQRHEQNVNEQSTKVNFARLFPAALAAHSADASASFSVGRNE